MFVASASPSSATASSLAFTTSVFASPHTLRTAPTIASAERSRFAFVAKATVGCTCEFTSANVRGASFGRFSKLVITTASQPIARSAPALPMRVA